MNKKVLKWTILIIIIILVLLFIGVQIFSLFRTGTETETATHATVTDSYQTEGLVIRKESLVKKRSSGVISYEVSDGTKIASDGVIASVYDDASAAAAEHKRMELNEQLDELKSLNKSTSNNSITPDVVNKQIYQKLYGLRTSVNDFNITDIATQRDEVLGLINQWQIVTGKTASFDERIQEIKNEISKISSSASASSMIKASAAGYFVEETDGFETVYDYDKVKQMTVEDLRTQQDPEEDNKNVIGKVCEQFDWYIACIVPPDTATNLVVGDEITVNLPSVTSMELPTKVVAINQTSIEEEAALILKCTYMDELLANIRNETVLLNIKTYDGIRVSQKAIHFKEVTGTVEDKDGNESTVTQEVRGVYVVDGSELKFVQVVPLYSSDNFVICDPNPDPNEILTDKTVELYDTVALGGDELYEGKTVR